MLIAREPSDSAAAMVVTHDFGFHPHPILARSIRMKTLVPVIEALEPRIAPSVVILNSHTATYTDVDGDLVTIKVSKGTLNDNVFTSTINMGGGGPPPEQLEEIDLTQGSGFNGANLTISVVQNGGDGFANIGFINATGIDLGKVVVPGDLALITAGESVKTPLGLQSLSVHSMGQFGTYTEPAASGSFTPSLESDITGDVGSLHVQQDVTDAVFFVTGKIGSIHIGGSLIGGAADGSGFIHSSSKIGLIKIDGDIQGGSGSNSGVIADTGGLPKVIIGGSIIGGTNDDSGRLAVDGNIGTVKIGHDFVGGTNFRAGWIEASSIGSITIAGSVIGGSGESSAEITTSGNIGSVIIGHDLQGGSATGSGRIYSMGNFASVDIGGSLIGGAALDTGEIKTDGHMGAITIAGDVQGSAALSTNSGYIYSGATLESVTIGGSLIGGAGVDSGFIYANTDILGAVKIGRDILGGSAGDSGGIYSNGNIPTVTVKGSLIGGSGSSNTGLIQGNTLGSVYIAHDVRGGTGLFSGFITASAKITSVTIGGSLIGGDGTNAASGEILGSENIGLVKIAGDLVGGNNASNTGVIRANGTINHVQIGGSVQGGSASQTGVIAAGENLNLLQIGGDLTGASIGSGAASLDQSGYVESSGGRIAKIVIGGSIISGTDDSSSGALTKNASIRSPDDIGSILVKGNLIGNSTSNGLSPVVISARGQAMPVVGTPNVAISKITVKGSVERANIFGDYDTSLSPTADGAQINLVKVLGDWIASNEVVGISNLGTDDSPGGTSTDADNVNFGDAHDFPIGLGPISAKIVKVIIGGTIAGTDTVNDHFGFSAVSLGTLQATGATIPLNSSGITEILTPTGDVSVHSFA